MAATSNQGTWVRLVSIGMVVLALTTGPAMAQVFIWDGGGADDNWTTAENWNLDVAPAFTPGSMHDIQFTGSVRTTPIVDTNAAGIDRIAFLAGADPFTIDNGGVMGRTITFDANGRIDNRSANLQIINVDLVATGDTLNVISDSQISFFGNIDLSDSGGVDLRVTGNAGTLITGVISGVGGRVFMDNDSGFLSLQGINTYTGATVASDGTLTILTGAEVAGNAVSEFTGNMQVIGRVRGNANSTGGTFDINNGGVVNGNANVSGGAMTLKTGGTLDGDAVVSGGTFVQETNAPIGGNVEVSGGATTLNHTVAGGASVTGGTLDMNTGTTIDGAVSVTGGTMTVNFGATVDDDVTVGQSSLLVSGTLNLAGTVTGDATVNGGTMDVINALNGTATVNSGEMIVRGTVGDGALVTGGTLTVDPAGSITGITDVQGGTLEVNGAVNGDVTATRMFFAFAFVEGNGDINGNLTAESGGVFNPGGDTVETFDVNGNLVQQSGSFYLVDVDKGAATQDQAMVTGSATFDQSSTIQVSQVDATEIVFGDTFTIINATGGVTDNGASVTFSSAASPLIGFETSVMGNDLILTAVRGGTFFEGFTVGPNNSSIGAALSDLNGEITDPMSPEAGLMNSLTALFNPADPNNVQLAEVVPLNNAVSQLSPKTYNVAAETNIEIARAAADRTSAYLGARRRGVPVQRVLANTRPLGPMLASAAPDPELLAYAMGAAKPPYQGYRSLDDGYAAKGRWGGFAQGFGLFEEKDTRAGKTGFDADAYGVQVGVDYAPWRNVIVGLSFSYINTDVDLNDGLGDSDIDSYRIGPYLSYEAKPWHFSYSLTFGLHEADNTRVMPLIPATATSDTDSWDVAFNAEGGIDYQIGENTYVTPMGSLQFLHFYQDDFVESGGGGAALSVDSRDTNSLRTRLGAGISHAIQNSKSKMVFEGYVGWEHEFMANDGDEIVARFAAGGSPFAVNVGSANEDSLFLGGGATVLVNQNVSLYVLYDGNFFTDGETHAVGGGVSVRF